MPAVVQDTAAVWDTAVEPVAAQDTAVEPVVREQIPAEHIHMLYTPTCSKAGSLPPARALPL